MHVRHAVLAVALLLLPTLGGCLGIDNMDELKLRLGATEAPPPGPPDAVLRVAPETAKVGQTVTLDATGSLDPAGDGLRFAWDLGDGTQASGATVTHAYDVPGRYVVTLTVRDALDRTATASTAVDVEAPDDPPVVVLQITDAAGRSTDTTLAGDPLRLSAAQSHDPEGTDLSFAWDLGDGTQATGATVTHNWTDPGVYTVAVTATDGAGLTATASNLVTVDYRLEVNGTADASATSFAHPFPATEGPRRLVVTLTWNTTLGVDDLDLEVQDADGATVGASNTSTSPGAQGEQREAIDLPRDALGDHPPGEWTVIVHRRSGVEVPYELTITMRY